MATSVRKSNQLTAAGTLTGNTPVIVGNGAGDYVVTTLDAIKSFINSGAGGGDTTPPVILSASIANSNPSRINFLSNELLTAASLSTSKFSVLVNGTAANVSAAAAANNTTGYVDLQDPVPAGATVTFSYTPGTTGVRIADAAGNFAAAFSNLAVTNAVQSSKLAQPALSFASDQPDGTGFQVQWSKDSRSNRISLRVALDSAFATVIQSSTGLTNAGNINIGNLSPSTAYWIEIIQVDSTATYQASDPGTGNHSTNAGFNRTLTFASSTNAASDGVDVEVSATDADLKFQFNAITNILGQSVNMEIYVGTDLVAVVTFYSDYVGQLFKFTDAAGVGHFAVFTSGTPVNF